MPRFFAQDKSPEQRALAMAAKIFEWYGPKRSDETHYGEILQAARQAKQTVLPQLIKLTKSNDVGPNVRATAVQLLGNYVGMEGSSAAIDAIVAASKDSEVMVRAASVSVMPATELLNNGERLLQDPIRDVRRQATMLFNTLPPDQWSANIAALMPAATKDYVLGQQAVIDTPEGNSNLGMLAYNQGNAATADQYFAHALKLFPLAPDAANMRARALSRQGKAAEAEQVLRDAIGRNQKMVDNLREGLKLIDAKQPRQRRETDIQLAQQNIAGLEMDLALLIAEKSERHVEAIQLLHSALEHHPQHPRAAFNLGTLYLSQKKYEEAEDQFRAAVKLEPRGIDVHQSLAETIIHRQKLSEAETLLKQLLQENPQVEFVLLLAQLYGMQKNWESAEQLLDYSRQRWADQRLLAALSQVYLASSAVDAANTTTNSAHATAKLVFREPLGHFSCLC
jgi:Flp pilus assembly protein TadD